MVWKQTFKWKVAWKFWNSSPDWGSEIPLPTNDIAKCLLIFSSENNIFMLNYGRFRKLMCIAMSGLFNFLHSARQKNRKVIFLCATILNIFSFLNNVSSVEANVIVGFAFKWHRHLLREHSRIHWAIARNSWCPRGPRPFRTLDGMQGRMHGVSTMQSIRNPPM